MRNPDSPTATGDLAHSQGHINIFLGFRKILWKSNCQLFNRTAFKIALQNFITISIFDESFNFCRNLYFWPKFRFWTKLLIFDQNFDFLPKLQFLTNISIFWQTFRFLTKTSIFDQIFGFWAKRQILVKMEIMAKHQILF